MKVKRKCVVCSIIFTIHDARMTTCSKICSKKHTVEYASGYQKAYKDRLKIKVKRHCVVCSARFITNDSRKKMCGIICSKKRNAYLSQKHQKTPEAKAHAKDRYQEHLKLVTTRESRQCTICGVKFMANYGGWHKTCSIVCSKKHRVEYNKKYQKNPDNIFMAKALRDASKNKSKRKVRYKFHRIRKDKLKIKVNRKCVICNTKFTVNGADGRKTCSTVCSKKYAKSYEAGRWKIQGNRHCVVCDVKFIVNDTGRHKTCSKICSKKRQTQLSKKYYNDPKNKPKQEMRQCIICPVKFMANCGGWRKTCSTSCSKKHKTEYTKLYHNDPKTKAKRATSENKAKLKIKRDTPENKVKQKARYELYKIRKEKLKNES